MFDIPSVPWRLALVVGGFLLFWTLESVSPFLNRPRRMIHAGRNLAVAAVNAVVLALILSGLTVGLADRAETARWGLLNSFALPPIARFLLALLVLDLWNYWWHRANHRIAFLWRFHRMHHSDPAMDVTTATRFHLGEISISAFLRLPLIPLAGLPFATLILYDLILLWCTQFHHSNIALPAAVDRLVRLLIVSPNMHRVHHSIERVETDSNYASVLSIWDRFFRSYRERHNFGGIRFGVDGLTDESHQSLRGLFLTPVLLPGKSERR